MPPGGPPVPVERPQVRVSSLGKGLSDVVLKSEKDAAPEMGGPGQTLLEAPPYRNAMVEETPARRPPPKPSFQRTLMYMMVFLTLFVLIDNNLRIAFGNAVGYVFGPTIGFGGAFPLLSLFLAGAFTTLISALSRHVFTDWVKMTRVNKKMRALQKAQMDALRRGNTAKVARLKELQSEIRMESMDVQLASLKPLAFTFLPFIVFWAWLSQFFYTDVVGLGHLYIAVPWAYQTDLLSGAVMPVWFLLYFVFTFLLGSVFTRLLKLLSFRKRLAAFEAAGGTG